MRPHPQISPYITREPGKVHLVVPLLGPDGITCLQVPLSRRAGALLALELAGAQCDQWADPIVRQPDDIEGLSHEGFLQAIDG